jgi:hypothetical protein
MAILGRPSTALALSGQVMGQGSQAGANGPQFDPFSAYGADLANTNFNASAAAKIAQANNDTAIAWVDWHLVIVDDSEDPTHINFNQSCESILWNQYGRPVDNSQFANVTSDVTWIVRPRPLPNPGLCPLPGDLSPQTACSVVLLPLPPSPPEPPSPPPQPSPPQPPPSLPAQFGLGVVVGTAVAGTVCGGALVALALLIIIPWSRRKLPARPLIEPLNPLSSSTVTLVTGGNAEHTHAA